MSDAMVSTRSRSEDAGDPPGARRHPRLPALLGLLVDDLADCLVVLVAWWSVLYWLFWALGLSLWPAGWIWLGTSAVGVLVAAGRRLRARRTPSGGVSTPEQPAEQPWAVLDRLPGQAARVLAGLALLCGIAAVLSTRGWPGHGFRWMWLFTLAGVCLAGLAQLVGRRPSVEGAGDSAGGTTREWGSPWWHLAAWGMAVAVAVLSLYIHLPDNDDPFYVNRSVWIAEHGTAMVRDTMFGPGTYVSPYNGGIPIASFEGLIGVGTHMTGIAVGTLTWIVTTAIGSFLAVWALWSLARAWAPRLPIVVTTVAVVFLLYSGDSRLGNFWIARIWQGKVLAVAILVPLAWVWATKLVEGHRRRPLVMLFVGGVAFAGLTSSAVVLAGLMGAAMVLTAVVLRRWWLALGGVLFVIGPLVSAAAVFLVSDDVGGANPALQSGARTFLRVLGNDRFMVALALFAVVVGVLLLRSRVAAGLVTWVAVGALAVLVPPVLHLINDLTGSGPILWRVLYTIPVALLVGMLAVVRLPARRPAVAEPWWHRLNRLAAVAAPVVLLAATVGLGASLWTTVDHNGPVTLKSEITWKVDPQALADVRALMETDPHGVVLLPPRQMHILSMYTTEVFAVDPRDWYSRILAARHHRPSERMQLKRLITATQPYPSPEQINRALDDLDVTEACLRTALPPAEKRAVQQSLNDAGYDHGPQQVGRMSCWFPD